MKRLVIIEEENNTTTIPTHPPPPPQCFLYLREAHEIVFRGRQRFWRGYEDFVRISEQGQEQHWHFSSRFLMSLSTGDLKDPQSSPQELEWGEQQQPKFLELNIRHMELEQ